MALFASYTSSGTWYVSTLIHFNTTPLHYLINYSLSPLIRIPESLTMTYTLCFGCVASFRQRNCRVILRHMSRIVLIRLHQPVLQNDINWVIRWFIEWDTTIIFTPSDILSLPECYQSFMKCKTLPVNITQSYQPLYVNILIHCFRSSAPTRHHQLYLIIRCNSDCFSP